MITSQRVNHHMQVQLWLLPQVLVQTPIWFVRFQYASSSPHRVPLCHHNSASLLIGFPQLGIFSLLLSSYLNPTTPLSFSSNSNIFLKSFPLTQVKTELFLFWLSIALTVYARYFSTLFNYSYFYILSLQLIYKLPWWGGVGGEVSFPGYPNAWYSAKYKH